MCHTTGVCGMYRVRCVPESARELVAVVAAETDKHVPRRSVRQVTYLGISARSRRIGQGISVATGQSPGGGMRHCWAHHEMTRTDAKPSESDPRRSGHFALCKKRAKPAMYCTVGVYSFTSIGLVFSFGVQLPAGAVARLRVTIGERV